MDKLTLKSMIIEYRESGLSFSDISEELLKKYNIRMSRQAVCGMYNRATSEDAVTKNKNLILSTSNILNYYCIGLALEDIKAIIGMNITISDIKKVIKDNTDNINTIRKTQLTKIVTSIKNGADINDIKRSMAFKGIQIDSKVFNKLVEMASEAYVKEAISYKIMNIYNMSNDKQLTKKLMNKFNINMSISELGRCQTKYSEDDDYDYIEIQDNDDSSLGVTINNGLIVAKV